MIPEIIYLFLLFFENVNNINNIYLYVVQLYSILNIKKSFQAGTEYKLMFTKKIYKEAKLIQYLSTYLNIFAAVRMSKPFKILILFTNIYLYKR